MTADSTTRLREALAEAAASVLGETVEVNGGELESVLTIYHPSGLGVLVACAILASLVEHRDDVLDVLGMEQAGWFCGGCGARVAGSAVEHALIEHGYFCGCPEPTPVYAFRPRGAAA